MALITKMMADINQLGNLVETQKKKIVELEKLKYEKQRRGDYSDNSNSPPLQKN